MIANAKVGRIMKEVKKLLLSEGGSNGGELMVLHVKGVSRLRKDFFSAGKV